MTSGHPVQFGSVGAGPITTNATAPALIDASNADLAAVASRDVGRARALHPKRAFDDHDAPLAGSDIETVNRLAAGDPGDGCKAAQVGGLSSPCFL